MSGLAKQITNLQKQNDGIYKSLVAKGVEFVRVIVDESDSEEVQVQKLTEENTELKKLSTANKPPPKEEKPKVVQQVQPKEKTNEENDEEYECFEDKKKKFTPIANMESMKISFFGGDYESFKSSAKEHPFLFFEATYKYNSYNDGMESWKAKNLIKGLTKDFDEEKKLFMSCFRCYQTETEPTKYEYRSWWIVNTFDPLLEVVKSSEDFDLVPVTDPVEIDAMLITMQKLPKSEDGDLPDGCLVEAYVH